MQPNIEINKFLCRKATGTVEYQFKVLFLVLNVFLRTLFVGSVNFLMKKDGLYCENTSRSRGKKSHFSSRGEKKVLQVW